MDELNSNIEDDPNITQTLNELWMRAHIEAERIRVSLTTSQRIDIREIKRHLATIDQNTEDMPWLSKFIANIFKFGGSQAEQKYPSQHKKK